jgi:hypothetical protein
MQHIVSRVRREYVFRCVEAFVTVLEKKAEEFTEQSFTSCTACGHKKRKRS